MRSFTCKGPCGRTYHVHLRPVPRDRVCTGCKYQPAPVPPPAAPAPKSAPLAFADLDPAERRRFGGSTLRLRGGFG